MKQRLIKVFLIALGGAYALTGLLFISTATPGGFSLGLLFLGGVAMLYFAVILKRQLDELKGLLRLLVFSERAGTEVRGRALGDEGEEVSHTTVDAFPTSRP